MLRTRAKLVKRRVRVTPMPSMTIENKAAKKTPMESAPTAPKRQRDGTPHPSAPLGKCARTTRQGEEVP